MKTKTDFIKMQGEHQALVLFCGILAAIIGAVIAVLSHYPVPPYMLGAIGFGVAAGAFISSQRENHFLQGYIEEQADERADELADELDIDLNLNS